MSVAGSTRSPSGSSKAASDQKAMTGQLVVLHLGGQRPDRGGRRPHPLAPHRTRDVDQEGDGARVQEAGPHDHVLRCDVGGLEERVHRARRGRSRRSRRRTARSGDRRVRRCGGGGRGGEPGPDGRRSHGPGERPRCRRRSWCSGCSCAFVVTLARAWSVRPLAPVEGGGEDRALRRATPPSCPLGDGTKRLGGSSSVLGLRRNGAFGSPGLLRCSGRVGGNCVLSARRRSQAEEVGLPDVVQHLFGRHAPPSGRAGSVRRAPR